MDDGLIWKIFKKKPITIRYLCDMNFMNAREAVALANQLNRNDNYYDCIPMEFAAKLNALTGLNIGGEVSATFMHWIPRLTEMVNNKEQQAEQKITDNLVKNYKKSKRDLVESYQKFQQDNAELIEIADVGSYPFFKAFREGWYANEGHSS